MLEIRTETHNPRHRLVDVIPLQTPYVIFIDPSSVCNFKCKFCPSNNVLGDDGTVHNIMKMSTFEKALSGMKKFPQKVKVVELYCIGEPLVNPDVPIMIKKLKNDYGGVCEVVRLTTNGSYLTHELSRELVDAGLDYVKISIESLNDAGYEDICGVHISNEKMMDEISYLYTISRGKTEIAIKIVDAALKSEEDKREFLRRFSPISDHTFIEKLKNIWPGYDKVPIDAGIKVNDIDYYTQHNGGHIICAYALTHMLVHANGDIGVCCLDWKHGTVYGNVMDMSLYEAWNSEHLKQFRIMHLEGRRKELCFCKDCVQVSNDDVDQDTEAIIRKLST